MDTIETTTEITTETTTETTTTTDVSPDKIKSFKLTNDGARDVRFRGEKLTSVSSHSHFGSRQNRWTELSLYRTVGGKLVLWIIGRTCWQGESDRHNVVICDDEAAVVAALEYDNEGGLGDLAKELLSDVGIDAAQVVE